jgi:hypothetical protein
VAWRVGADTAGGPGCGGACRGSWLIAGSPGRGQATAAPTSGITTTALSRVVTIARLVRAPGRRRVKSGLVLRVVELDRPGLAAFLRVPPWSGRWPFPRVFFGAGPVEPDGRRAGACGTAIRGDFRPGPVGRDALKGLAARRCSWPWRALPFPGRRLGLSSWCRGRRRTRRIRGWRSTVVLSSTGEAWRVETWRLSVYDPNCTQ